MSTRFDSKSDSQKGSKKKSRANRRKGKVADEADETDSVGSGGAGADEKQAETVEMTFEDSFRADIDNLSQKRAVTRVAAYKKLCDKVAQNMLGSWLESFEETLKLHLYSSLKKGDGEEISLACRLLMVVCISMVDRSEELFRSSKSHLSSLIRNRSRSHGIRTAAMEAFAFLASFNLENFYGTAESAARQEDLDVLSAFFEKDAKSLMVEEKRLEGEHYSSARHGSDADDYSSNTDASDAAAVKPQLSASSLPVVVGPSGTPPLILSQALSSWCLVASTFSSAYLASKLLPKYLPQFRAFLHHDSIDVREAAGECIALLFAAYQTENQDESDDDDDEPSTNGHDALNDADKDSDAHTVVRSEPSEERKNAHSKDKANGAGDEESKPSAASSPPATAVATPTLANGVQDPPAAAAPASSSSTSSSADDSKSVGSNGHLNGKAKVKTKAAGAVRRPPKLKNHRQLSVSSIRYDPKNQEARSELTALLNDLSHESDRSESRRTRARQRAAFRDILATVESAEIPSEVLQIGKWKYEFVGWNQLIQLNSLRAVLGSGLLIHFKRNPFFGAVFDMDIESDDDSSTDLDRQQKKAISKAKEKVTFQEINKQRKKKNAFIREQFQEDE